MLLVILGSLIGLLLGVTLVYVVATKIHERASRIDDDVLSEAIIARRSAESSPVS